MAPRTTSSLIRPSGMSLAAFGRLLNVDKTTVLRWEKHRVPAERVLDLERVTGIPRETIRPDLYVQAEISA